MQAEDMCADCLTSAAYFEQGGPFSGGPCAAWPEVVQQLQKLQLQYPDAEVRRGRANRWELWPKEGQNRPAKK
jgi:hypothetical protein